MTPVFISHNHEDDPFVDRLIRNLQQHGIETFADHMNIRGPAFWNTEVHNALEACEQMIAVVSPRSIASKNCTDEWHTFIEDRKELVPVWCSGDKMYFAFRTAIRVDFRDADKFDQSLAELIRLLQDGKPQLVPADRPTPQTTPTPTTVLEPGLRDLYPLARRPDKFIGIATGNVGKIAGADVLVNSENDLLEMDRPVGNTLSAALNAFSADWDDAGRPIRQTVKLELTAAAERLTLPAPPGTVVVTSAGNLATNNVRHIIHAVSVRSQRGEASFVPGTRIQLQRCVTNTLACIDQLNAERYHADPLKRVVMPMFGTNSGNVKVTEIVPLLIERAIDYLETHDTQLETVYFSAYKHYELAQLKAIIDAIPDLNRPVQGLG